MQQEQIERQISKIEESKNQATSSKPALKKLGEIDLDALKNEFTEVDFHPLEPTPPDKYMYSVYYDNV